MKTNFLAFFAIFAVFAALAAISVASCGGRDKRSLGAVSAVDADGAPVPIGKAVEQIRSSAIPPGADPEVFETLKNELIKQISVRAASAQGLIKPRVPQGDAGRVEDLSYNAETGKIEWSYVHRGDYDLSGDVGIPDLTPIALNYGARTNDFIGDDAYEAWIDGDNDGEVGISDVTPIAMAYLSEIAAYEILTAEYGDGNFEPSGAKIPVTASEEGFPKRYAIDVPDGLQAYVKVRPIDKLGYKGETSNFAIIAGNSEVPPGERQLGDIEEDIEEPENPLPFADGPFPLPSKFDLSEFCSPIRDQEFWPTCSAFAAGDGAYTYELKRIYGPYGWDYGNSFHLTSPKYLHIESGKYQKLPFGLGYGRATGKVLEYLRDFGVASELSVPYVAPYSDEWSDRAVEEAALLNIESFTLVPCRTPQGIESIKKVLAYHEVPLVMRISVDESFFGLSGAEVWNFTGPFLGGHAALITGYDNVKQAFKIKNSWGLEWGDRGYGWIGYDSFLHPETRPLSWYVYDEYDPAVAARFLENIPDVTPPTGVAASDGDYAGKIVVTWDSVENATSYNIYRDYQGNLVGTAEGVTFWEDTPINDRYVHTYWVRAVNDWYMTPASKPDTGYVTQSLRISGFQIRISGGDGVDVIFDSYLDNHEAFIAGCSEYLLELYSIYVEKYNPVTNDYEAPVLIFPDYPDWRTYWEDDFRWINYNSNTQFDRVIGRTVQVETGFDSPYSTYFAGYVGDIRCFVTLRVHHHPGAPEFVAVEPQKMNYDQFDEQWFSLYCNLKDAGGTAEPELYLPRYNWWYPDYQHIYPFEYKIDFNSNVTDPSDLSIGEFFVKNEYSEEHNTSHVVYFKPNTHTVSRVHYLRIRNRAGIVSSVYQPPMSGTTLTSLKIELEYTPPPPPPPPTSGWHNLRVSPVNVSNSGAFSRIIVTPSNPRVQIYPGVYRENFAPDKYRKYVRTRGIEFAPYRAAPTDPPNVFNAPWARIYRDFPFKDSLIKPNNPLGFDSSVGYIASTAVRETTIGGGYAHYVSDWNVMEWNRIAVDLRDDDIIQPCDPDDPEDVYYVVVFALQEYWSSKRPVGGAPFKKTSINPEIETPQISAIAEAAAAWAEDGDWPRIAYPNENGVVINLSGEHPENPALFVIAQGIHTEVFFNQSPNAPFDSTRGASIKLSKDASGFFPIVRIVPNETAWAETFLSAGKNSHHPTEYSPTTNPPGYVPPNPPGIGDPGVLWDDNDAGWMVLPFSEFDYEGVFALNPSVYVSVGNWDPARMGQNRWLDSPAHYAPLTVILP